METKNYTFIALKHHYKYAYRNILILILLSNSYAGAQVASANRPTLTVNANSGEPTLVMDKGILQSTNYGKQINDVLLLAKSESLEKNIEMMATNQIQVYANIIERLSSIITNQK